MAAILPAILALGQAGYGLYQQQQGKKLLKEAEANRPDYQIPDSIKRAMLTSELESMRGLPEEVKSQMNLQMDRSRMASLSQINERRGGLGAISQLEQQQQDAIRQQALMDVQQREKNLMGMQNMRMKMAEQEQARWQWDEGQRYEEQLAKGQAMSGAGMQNIFGGVTSMATMAADGGLGDLGFGGEDGNIFSGKARQAYNTGIADKSIASGVSFKDWKTTQRAAGTLPGRDLRYKAGQFLQNKAQPFLNKFQNIQGGTGLNTIDAGNENIGTAVIGSSLTTDYVAPTVFQGALGGQGNVESSDIYGLTTPAGDMGTISTSVVPNYDSSPQTGGNIESNIEAQYREDYDAGVGSDGVFGKGTKYEGMSYEDWRKMQGIGITEGTTSSETTLNPGDPGFIGPTQQTGGAQPTTTGLYGETIPRGGEVNISGPSLQDRTTVDTSPNTSPVEVPELDEGGIDYTLDPVTGNKIFSEEDKEAAIEGTSEITTGDTEEGFIGPKEATFQDIRKGTTTEEIIQEGRKFDVKESTGPSIISNEGTTIPLNNEGQIDYDALDIPYEEEFPDPPLFYHANGTPWNNNLDTFKEVGKLGGVMDGKHVLFDKDGNRILPNKDGLPMSPEDSKLRFDFMELPADEQQKIKVDYEGNMDRYFNEIKAKQQKEKEEARRETYRQEMHAISNYGKPVAFLQPHEVQTTLLGINANSNLGVAMKNNFGSYSKLMFDDTPESNLFAGNQFPLQNKYS